MDLNLILLFVNSALIIGFGITAFGMIKRKDKERDDLKGMLQVANEEWARDLDRLNAVRNSNRELEEHLFRVRDQKSHLSKRLDGCNEAYKKAMEMNAQQEAVIEEMEKWTRGRDPKTGRFKPKNK